MKDYIIKELEYYSRILESHFHDMMDIEFTIENGKFYILSARAGMRSDFANLRIVISMFCEGKISVNDVFKKLPYQQRIKFLVQGSAASSGVGTATICYSVFEAENLVERKEEFIFCQEELSPDTIEIVHSKYCKGVITTRGGISSHAAVLCRGIHKPCVCGVGDFYQVKNLFELYGKKITIDGNNGKVFAGIGKIEKSNVNIVEIKMLYELLLVVIKYNIITSETSPLIWRLWDVIVLNKRYGRNNTKGLVTHISDRYKSFKQPDKKEIDDIYLKL